MEQWRDWDVTGLLPGVTAQTLVTNDGAVPRDASQRLAAALANGSFVAHQPLRGDPSPTEEAVSAFLRRVFDAEYGGGPGAGAWRGAEAPGSAGARDGHRLTRREIEVLQLLARGRSNRQIAEDLVLSERTVVRHIANIYDKLDVHGRAEATAYAVRRGLA
jgi:DNA-binding NarL/FixJ family response regulator